MSTCASTWDRIFGLIRILLLLFLLHILFFLFFLSLGVNVYLDVALRRALGIDPKKDSFTIKMTGGPDGAL
jgi:hypothetical protein